MTRWLVTGAAGLLGREMVAALSAVDAKVTATTHATLDITDPAAVADAVVGHDVVVNAAGWTDVDRAEAEESAATLVNGTAVGHLAAACATTGARLLHVSTDYIFDGDATVPYPEDARPAPINAYGRGKLVGERAVLDVLPDAGYVVRTAWLYGPPAGNFVTTMLRLAGERETVQVVDDQRGQPTWSYALAERLVTLGERAVGRRARAGIYHGTAGGHTTWFGLARALFTEAGLDPQRVQPASRDQFVRPARRPTYCVLGQERWALAGLAPMTDWRVSLHAAMPALTTRS
jgi:dTDP-4-dehydrorhamnose reductase